MPFVFNNVGCICELGGAASQASATSVSAGMATVVVQESEQQQTTAQK